jgi:hypothetical protein
MGSAVCNGHTPSLPARRLKHVLALRAHARPTRLTGPAEIPDWTARSKAVEMMLNQGFG